MNRVAPLIFGLICVAAAPAKDYEGHVAELKRKIPPGFSIVVQEPFVVIGDGGAIAVGQSATGTVKWAVDHLKADFFQDDPEEILDIWLFKDRDSYNKYTQEIFKDTPGTPYGYFSHKHKALIMNIATGGGTLVHEIVHPFMYANFPECPQERGLLIDFYKEFVVNQKQDPSGFNTLKKQLGEEDMDAFKKKWEAYVLKLTFP